MSARRHLYALLMILMIMPSMACFKSICVAGMMAGSHMPCCRDMAAHKTTGLALVKDCLNNDLAQVGVAKVPVPSGAILFASLVTIAFLFTAIPRRGALLRAGKPPPDPYSHPFNILLATQRFRN